MEYSIEEHRHRFAAWAASRAASVKTCRFKVEAGKIILEKSGVIVIGKRIENLPQPREFNLYHRKWRQDVILAAAGLDLKFTHGIAAKLINIYLKSIYVCGSEYNDPRIAAIHPPIDSILLDELYHQNVGGYRQKWNKARKIRWSKLNSNEYEELITQIKEFTLDGVGLWTIEKFWRGYQ